MWRQTNRTRLQMRPSLSIPIRGIQGRWSMSTGRAGNPEKWFSSGCAANPVRRMRITPTPGPWSMTRAILRALLPFPMSCAGWRVTLSMSWRALRHLVFRAVPRSDWSNPSKSSSSLPRRPRHLHRFLWSLVRFQARFATSKRDRLSPALR